MNDVVTRISDPDQNVVLTGFMGTGKSTTGLRLARLLGFDFIDTDDVIIERHGPIPALFEVRGENRFRQIERGVAAELSTRRRVVVATGGRMLLDPQNERSLGASGQVFCLWATANEIIERIRQSRRGVDRPLLAGADPDARVRELLAERAAGYRRFPQLRTGGLDSGQVADEIAKLVAEPPTVRLGTTGRTVVGIGISARVAEVPTNDCTVVDVGRVQPARGISAVELIAIQFALAAHLDH